MYCIARYCVLPSLNQEHASRLLTEAALHSLAEVFEAVPDPRGRHGLRYDLAFLLTCLVAALLCNCDGTEAVAGWCQDHVALLREVFGPRLFLTPSGSLYRWLLPLLDAGALEGVLGRRVQATTSALHACQGYCTHGGLRPCDAIPSGQFHTGPTTRQAVEAHHAINGVGRDRTLPRTVRCGSPAL